MSTQQKKHSQPEHADDCQSEKSERKPYHKPRLEKLGDLRSLTLGPSIGPPNDSSSGWPADTYL